MERKINWHITTEALRSRLEGVGLTDPWLLYKSNIFEKPIVNLGIILRKAPLPSFLREAASSELVLLDNSLSTLFTGRIRLREAERTGANTIFSGYFEHFDGQTKRVSVIQKLKRAHPNCQILVREIVGRSSRGRAIGGDDARVRCGLRFGGWISDHTWSVSIDSGRPAAEGHQGRPLRSIGPLTQAYNECRKYPESFHYLQDTDTENVFHFADTSTRTNKPGISEFKFFTFNRYLNLVFRELART